MAILKIEPDVKVAGEIVRQPTRLRGEGGKVKWYEWIGFLSAAIFILYELVKRGGF